MATHWMVDSGASRSSRQRLSATLTIEVSRIDITAPTITTIATRMISGLSLSSRRSPASVASVTRARARTSAREGMAKHTSTATSEATALIVKAPVKPDSAG